MPTCGPHRKRHAVFALGVLVLAAAASSAQAQSADVTVRLIELLVKNGTLSRTQATALLQEAQQEAKTPHRAAARRTVTAAPPAGAVASAATPADTADAVPPGTVRVTYVPPSVRAQIADQVRQEVLAQQQQQGWAAPNEVPDWVHRIRIGGDIRLRGERDFFPNGNFPTFPDFNAIDGSSNGFDTNGSALPPQLNTTESRNQFKLRARLDVGARIADWVDADIRVATGNTNNPVSTNQTLGSPGDFAKYALWLDRAYIKLRPVEGLTFYAGRMPNPFWTTNLLYDDDLNFDGVAAQASVPFGKSVSGYLTAGAFPVFNTAFNFGTTNLARYPSRDSYLFALQGGADWKINEQTQTKFGLGYFAYSNIEGQQSSPCFNPTGFGSCDTDNTKPAFVQFGNTLFPLRNIVQSPSTPNGPNPEYYGLASQFDLLDLRAQLKLLNFHPIDIVLDADYVKNLAYSRATALAHGPVNNLGTNDAYQGGSNGYMGAVTVGHQQLEKLWDWNVSLAYKYLESDAVVDAFTDSDFHLGGTNAKGTVLNGKLALANGLWLETSWLSAQQVSGPNYATQSLFVDLNAKF